MADERDPKLSQHYGQLEALEPSRELDQTILAAARRATGSAHAPRVAPSGRHRWYYSLAAAAVLVFAVALTIHIERERPDMEAAAPARAPEVRTERELRGEIKPAPSPDAKPAVKPEAKSETKPEAPAQTFTPDPQRRTPETAAAAPQEANRDAAGAQSSAPTPLAKPAPSPAPAVARATRSDELRRGS